MKIRQPIITVLGHVDHGKTQLLDYIRGTAIAAKEAGAITQHIGATEIPLDVIKKVSGDLLKKFKLEYTLPGLLFIDTPGHEAFTNLRKRGGSVADLAVVVIDIMQGIQPQTKEAIEILKSFKVPFIVAANKIDLLAGWKPHSKIFIENVEKQLQSSKEQFEDRFYKLIGQLSELGFDSDLYTRVENYTKKIAIVPTSAKTGEGISELMALLTGLSQKYLEKNLKIETSGPAKGVVLEVKEELGRGTTADAIIYDGSLNAHDILIVGGIGETVKTKIRSLLKPLPLVEIREAKKQFINVEEVAAATGVKIIAPDLDKVISGAPLRSAKSAEEVEAAEREIKAELEEIKVETESIGIVLKTDTLGSMEAVSGMLKEKNIPLQKVEIGIINKKDVLEAVAAAEKNPLFGFVLGFNVKIDDEAKRLADEKKINIIADKVVYKLIEKYEDLVEKKKKEIELRKLAGLTWPAKFKILPGFVFRQSNPAVFGVEVIAGKLRPKVGIINKEGKEIAEIKTIESEGKKLEELPTGEKAAISVPGITVGRQVKEGDVLFVSINEHDFRKLKKRKELLSQAEINILKEIAELKRKEKVTWGL
ncbi:translation initiation factor IF-2 [Candidatus Woesearchaeota archaeon]|nr:translation initiation factor IF-2 [Candidatus Woesearchaeota archaeon]